MKTELSYSRAIWWGDCYLGTLEPVGQIRELLKNNMDVDYYFSRELGSLISQKIHNMQQPDINLWWSMVLSLDKFREVESMAESRDLRDVWFVDPPSWLPEGWRDDLRLEPH